MEERMEFALAGPTRADLTSTRGWRYTAGSIFDSYTLPFEGRDEEEADASQEAYGTAAQRSETGGAG
jgi:hypothetical protein